VITSVYRINWLVFTTKVECVYCAVRTESLNMIHFNLRLLRVKEKPYNLVPHIVFALRIHSCSGSCLLPVGVVRHSEVNISITKYYDK
jgi:hypothetical protein